MTSIEVGNNRINDHVERGTGDSTGKKYLLMAGRGGKDNT